MGQARRVCGFSVSSLLSFFFQSEECVCAELFVVFAGYEYSHRFTLDIQSPSRLAMCSWHAGEGTSEVLYGNLCSCCGRTREDKSITRAGAFLIRLLHEEISS